MKPFSWLALVWLMVAAGYEAFTDGGDQFPLTIAVVGVGLAVLSLHDRD